jgi:polysaccharide transporter, PST family
MPFAVPFIKSKIAPMKQKIESNKSTKGIALATVWLVLFQILGLIIPILTLPVLARGLGVVVFGQVMLAQAIVFLAVLFLDSGFNVESQRRASVATTALQVHQTLVDNFIARAVCCLPVVVAALLFGYFMPNTPFFLILASLLLVCGTLLFPQWWYVAQHQGVKMGIVATVGRLLSAAAIVLWVHSPADALIAALAACSATLLSGVILLPQWWRNFKPHVALINWHSWKKYLLDVRHTIFSGFFSSASASVPVIALGAFAGSFQTGLFSAADRLTRAAAYLLSFIEQSFMGWLAKIDQQNPVQSIRIRKQVLMILACALLIGCSAVAIFSSWALQFLYGDSFMNAIPILQTLSLWLLVYGVRKAMLTFYWSATGDLKTVAMFQWFEAALVCLLAVCGAVWSGGLGVAVGLSISEILLLTAMMVYHNRSVE